MKYFSCAVLLTALISVGHVQASDGMSMKKIKTGILPSGEFYTLYEATCLDQTTASLASLDRRTSWCLQNAGELSCFRQSREALHAACLSEDIASTESDLDTINSFQ